MYDLGYYLALGIGCLYVLLALFSIWSTQAYNFKKIDRHYSLAFGNFSSKKPVTFIKLIIFTIWSLGISPFFSWLSVIATVAAFIWQKNQESHLPESVKLVLFKIKNVELNKIEMLNIGMDADLLFNKTNASRDYMPLAVNPNYFWTLDTRSQTFMIIKKDMKKFLIVSENSYFRSHDGNIYFKTENVLDVFEKDELKKLNLYSSGNGTLKDLNEYFNN